MACKLLDDVTEVVNREIEEWLLCNNEGNIVLLEVSFFTGQFLLEDCWKISRIETKLQYRTWIIQKSVFKTRLRSFTCISRWWQIPCPFVYRLYSLQPMPKNCDSPSVSDASMLTYVTTHFTASLFCHVHFTIVQFPFSKGHLLNLPIQGLLGNRFHK